jgi:sporulation protein YabP
MQGAVAPKGATILLKNRESVTLSGVEDVLSFDDTVVSCRTTLGDLTIEGSSLRITDFCAERGELSVLGTISVLAYEEKREGKGRTLGHLFRK